METERKDPNKLGRTKNNEIHTTGALVERNDEHVLKGTIVSTVTAQGSDLDTETSGKAKKNRGRRQIHLPKKMPNVSSDVQQKSLPAKQPAWKAELMMETSSMDNRRLWQLLEDHRSHSGMNFGQVPSLISNAEMFTSFGDLASFKFRPEGGERPTVPAKDVAVWQRHNRPKSVKGLAASGTSVGGSAKFHIGGGARSVSSKNFSSKSGMRSLTRKHAILAQHQQHKSVVSLRWYWYERSTGERMVFMFIALLFVLFLVHLLVAIYFVYAGVITSYDVDVCTNSSCKAFAGFLSSRLDTSVDPCDDFYDYVCGRQRFPEDDQYQIQKAVDFRHFTVPFDFTKSVPLGGFMQAAAKKGLDLILHFYKLCMDRRKRQKNALMEFKMVLQRIGLGSSEKIKNITKQSILTQWFVNSPADVFFSFEYNNTDKEALLFKVACGNVACRYLTKTFATYKKMVAGALKMVREELDINEDEIEIMASDIVCTEALFQEAWNSATQYNFTEHFLNDDINTTCSSNGSGFAKSMNTFGLGSDNAPLSGVLNEVIHAAIDEFLKGHGHAVKPADIKVTFRNDSKYEMELRKYFDLDTTAYRLGVYPMILIITEARRFLQWTLFREMSADLTVEIFNHFYLWEVNDHRLMDFYCFERLFALIPGIPTSHYVTLSADEEPSIKAEEINTRLEFGWHSVLQDAPIPTGLRNGSAFQSKTDEEILSVLEDILWVDASTLLDTVRARWLKALSLNTVQYSKKLAKATSHVVGIANLLQFKASLMYQNFVTFEDIPFYIFRDGQQRSIYAFRTLFASLVNRLVVPPIGLQEFPFFRYGLYALDLGGYGSMVAQERVKYAFNWIMAKDYAHLGLNSSVEHMVVEYEQLIGEKLNLAQKEFLKWGNDLPRSHYKEVQLIANQLGLEVVWRTLSDTLESVGGPTKKLNIEGIPTYSYGQLFFLQYTRVRCVNLNNTELYEAMTVPSYTPWKLMVNAALANTKAFNETWGCKRNSKMVSDRRMNFLEST